MVEIDKGVRRPQALAESFAFNQLTGPLQQHDQNFKGLTLQFDSDPTLPQLTCFQVYFESSKSNGTGASRSDHVHELGTVAQSVSPPAWGARYLCVSNSAILLSFNSLPTEEHVNLLALR